VAIVASGGLSHFVIDEELDRSVLAAIEQKDESGICRWPESKFQSGTSEIKTWIVLAAPWKKPRCKCDPLITYPATALSPAPESTLGLPSGSKPEQYRV
jgi:hypothetical protein